MSIGVFEYGNQAKSNQLLKRSDSSKREAESENNHMANSSEFVFNDIEFEAQLLDENSANHGRIVDFLTHLAICHSVTQQSTKQKIKNSPPSNRP
jgi:hypothetical protein